MSPLEAARKLAETWEPIMPSQSGTNAMNWYQWAICGGYGAPMADAHAPGCPWLMLPQIIAVLEAAEHG